MNDHFRGAEPRQLDEQAMSVLGRPLSRSSFTYATRRLSGASNRASLTAEKLAFRV
jgi:hypothetical protein